MSTTPLPGDAGRRSLGGMLGPRRLDRSRRHPLLWFVVRRLAAGAVLLVVVSVLVFAATNVLPGDAASAVLGRQATPASLAALREELGLDRPLARQYLDWIGGVVQGDLGTSLTARRPVWEVIQHRASNTLALAAYTMAFLVPLSLLLGVFAGTRAGRASDQLVSGATLGVIAVPEFVICSVLVLLFAVTWKFL